MLKLRVDKQQDKDHTGGSGTQTPVVWQWNLNQLLNCFPPTWWRSGRGNGWRVSRILDTASLWSQVHLIGSGCLECSIERAGSHLQAPGTASCDWLAMSVMSAGSENSSVHARHFSSLDQLNTYPRFLPPAQFGVCGPQFFLQRFPGPSLTAPGHLFQRSQLSCRQSQRCNLN